MKIILLGSNSEIAKDLIAKYENDKKNEFVLFQRVIPKKLIPKKKYIKLDLQKDDLKKVINKNKKNLLKWSLLIISVGDLMPIGKYLDIKFSKIKKSLDTNFLKQIEFIHILLNLENNKNKTIITFAGSGTNGTADNIMSYSLSKVSLIKFTELINSEIKQLKIVSLGPGWYKSKLHNSTLQNKIQSGKNYDKTIINLKRADNIVKAELIFKFINWVLKKPINVVSGRNFSIQDDMKYFIENKNLKVFKSKSFFKLRTR
tara:strand:+ start:8292 stop:9068 length:777 start_codon:yes stop_codon:yes gene_type:complete